MSSVLQSKRSPHGHRWWRASPGRVLELIVQVHTRLLVAQLDVHRELRAGEGLAGVDGGGANLQRGALQTVMTALRQAQAGGG